MNKKLVTIIDSFETWDFYSPLDNKLKTNVYENVPFITHPNGIPCFEANLYIQTKLRKGLSRRVRGGSLSTYSYNISHIVRFCFNKKLKFTELTDDLFTIFIESLQAERSLAGKLERKNNQVIVIGRRCIDFLLFINELYGCKCFIGEGIENSVRVKKESKRHGKKVNFVYKHISFPTPNSNHIRKPMSDNAGAAIKKVIASNENKDIRKRDMCIYQTLEQTGARRTEVTMITVNDILNAIESDEESPLLLLSTLKRKDEKETRRIPVTRVYLNNIHNYIRTTRKKIIKAKISKGKLIEDHGILFIAMTGNPLSPDSLTTMMNNFRDAAGLDEDAFAHLLRHAFLTEKLKCIILEHDFNNPDEFRKALLNTERFKMVLKEWSGHTHITSLDVYIDLAFADLAGVQKSYHVISIKDSIGLVRDKLTELTINLKNKKIHVIDATEELLSTIIALELDLDDSYLESDKFPTI